MKKVREGYKMTELGEIPEEWEVKKLNEVTKLIKDGTHNPPPRTENGIPLLSAENIFNNRVNFGLNEKNISIKSYENMHKNYVIENGDVLMTIVGTIGRTAVVKSESKFTVQRSVAIFKVKDEIEPFYFNYCLNSHYFQKQLKIRANTTAQSGIYLGELSKMSLGIPSNREQQKIASILSSVDEQIEITDNLIEKTKELKKGLMQRLLTKGIGHEKFKDTEIGRISEEWEVRKLGDVCTLKGRIGWRGYTKNDLRESGPLVIGATQISRNNRIDLSNPVYISVDKYEESPEIKVCIEDIILVKTGNTIGKVAIVENNIGDATINPNTVLVKDIKCNNKFLYYIIASHLVQRILTSMITVGAQPSVNQDKLKQIIVPIPTLKEQQKIASILSSVDNQIEEYQTKKEKLEELKKGLMQNLLTGKVRVKI